MSPANVNFAVRASETFSGQSLGVDFVLEGNGEKYSGRTDRDPIQLPVGRYTLGVGINSSGQRTTDTLVPTLIDGFIVDGSGEFSIDLASESRLFSSPTLGRIDATSVIDVYRGRGNQGRNQTWRTQPRAYIVSDPGNGLARYEDPRSNAEIDYIIRGFEIVADYTRGFLRVPARSELQIPQQDRNYPSLAPGEFLIRLSPSGGLELELRSNDAIVASFAQGSASVPGALTLQSEMVSAVQGGDSESDGYFNNVMRNRPINDLDRVWGDFNYHQRRNGDVILPSSSAHQFPHELRLR